MKTDINLLSPHRKLKDVIRGFSLSFIIVVFLIFAVLVGILQPIRLKYSLKNRSKKNKEEMIRYENIQDKFIDTQEQLMILTNKHEDILEIKNAQLKLSEDIKIIQRTAPESINITRMSADRKGIHFEGISISDLEIAQLVVNLKKNHGFMDVYINGIYLQENLKSSQFDIDCFYQKNSMKK